MQADKAEQHARPTEQAQGKQRLGLHAPELQCITDGQQRQPWQQQVARVLVDPGQGQQVHHMGQAVEHTDQGVAANPQLLAEGHEIGKCHDHGETEQKLHRQQPRHVRRKFAQGLGLLAVQGMPGRVIGQRQYQHEGQQRQPGQPAVQVYAQALRGQ